MEKAPVPAARFSPRGPRVPPEWVLVHSFAHCCAFSAAALLQVTGTAPCWARMVLCAVRYACTSSSEALLPLPPELLLPEVVEVVPELEDPEFELPELEFEFELELEFELEFEFEFELLFELEEEVVVALAWVVVLVVECVVTARVALGASLVEEVEVVVGLTDEVVDVVLCVVVEVVEERAEVMNREEVEVTDDETGCVPKPWWTNWADSVVAVGDAVVDVDVDEKVSGSPQASAM
jgi:hypothetical protein